MTACVNKKSKRVAAVVTASLVGALSIGAPAVALAANANIDLLNVTPEVALKNSTLVSATNGKGEQADVSKTLEFEVGTYLVPTEIKPQEAASIKLVTDGAEKNSTIVYYANTTPGGKNTIDSKTEVKPANFAAGNFYWARVTIVEAQSEYNGCTYDVCFKVVGKSLKDAVLYNKLNGNTDVSLDDFVYNGSDFVNSIGVALEGENFAACNKTYFDAVSGQEINKITNAGSYIVRLSGTGDYKGSTVDVPLTIQKLDLSKALLTLDDTTVANVDSNIDFVAELLKVETGLANPEAELDFAIKNSPSGSPVYKENGSYTYTITPKATSAANIAGTADVTFNKVSELLTTFKYGNTVLKDDKTVVSVDLSKNESVDLSKLVISDGTSAKQLTEDKLSIEVYDADGNKVSTDSLKNAGTWTVKFRVNCGHKDVDYKYGSVVRTVKFKVTKGTIASNTSVFFTFDGETVKDNNVNPTFDTTDQLAKLQVVVKDSKGNTLTQGTDYDVVVTKGGEEVSEAVNAGKYTVKVVSDAYAFDTNYNDVTIDVAKLDLTKVTTHIESPAFHVINKKYYVAYTGSAIEGFTFSWDLVDEDGNVVKNVDLTDKDVKVDTVRYKGANGWGDAKEVKAEGTYNFQISALADGNYIGTLKTDDNFIVSSKSVVFQDVQINDWFSGAIYDADQLGYIAGIQGGELFAPNRSITRADAVVIVSRMAGVDDLFHGDDEDKLGLQEYMTSYSDVNTKMYYAKSIAWATKMGIVHGSNGQFRPDDAITREEFAAILNNYAIALRKDATADDVDGTLGKYADGSAVAPWFENAVAWAVEEGVMGNGGALNPASDITRAEVAAMAVNFQPENLANPVL